MSAAWWGPRVALWRVLASGACCAAAAPFLPYSGASPARFPSPACLPWLHARCAALRRASLRTTPAPLLTLATHRWPPPPPPLFHLLCSPADAITSYFRALGNTPVLGRAKEARLAGILQRGRQLEALAAQLGGGAPAGGADLAALAAAAGLRSAADAAQVLMNRREAKDLLMQHNVR